MSHRFACGTCGAQYQAQADRAGRVFRCKKCQAELTVPTSPAVAVLATPLPSAGRRPAPAAQPSSQVSLPPAAPPEAAGQPGIEANLFDDLRRESEVETRTKDEHEGSPAAPPEKIPLLHILGALTAAYLLIIGLAALFPGIAHGLVYGWCALSFGLVLIAIVQSYRAMSGGQRFWILLSMLLRPFGLQLFVFDTTPMTPERWRALGWIGISMSCCVAAVGAMALTGLRAADRERVAAVEPAEKNNAPRTRRVVPAERSAPVAARSERLASQPEDRPGPSSVMPPPGVPPFGGPFGGPPGMAPPGFPGAGDFPLRIRYVSLAHSAAETAERGEELFRTNPIYIPQSFRVNEAEQRIELLVRYPPPPDQVPVINALLTAAGIEQPSRSSRRKTTPASPETPKAP